VAIAPPVPAVPAPPVAPAVEPGPTGPDTPDLAQVSPSDAPPAPDQDAETIKSLQREIERLKQRNEGFEQAIRQLQEELKKSSSERQPRDPGDGDSTRKLQSQIQSIAAALRSVNDRVDELSRPVETRAPRDASDRIRQLANSQKRLDAAVQELDAAFKDRDAEIDKQLKSIFESVARLQPDASQRELNQSIRDIKTLIDAVPELIEKRVEQDFAAWAEQQEDRQKEAIAAAISRLRRAAQQTDRADKKQDQPERK
jgi:hypothetical protein